MNSHTTPSSTRRPLTRTMRWLTAAAVLALAGCAQTFPKMPLTAEEKQYEQQLQSSGDNDAKVALGQLYFMKNEIDRADEVLSPVVASDPNNAQAWAWHGANDCKRAARRGPWLMGMDKLYMVKDCLDQIEAAYKLAPNDFTVQMVRMETGQLVDKFGSLDRAVATQLQVEQLLKANPQALPAEARAQFRVTAARIERKRGNADRAKALLDQATAETSLPTTQDSIAQERRVLAGG